MAKVSNLSHSVGSPTDETASQQQAKQALQEVVVPDKRGRRLTLRQVPILRKINFPLLIGAARAENTTYMGMVMPLLYLAKIDDADVVMTNAREIDMLITVLDEDGLEALSNGVKEYFLPPDENEAVQVHKDAVKK